MSQDGAKSSRRTSPTNIKLEEDIYRDVENLAKLHRRTIAAEINYLLEIAINQLSGNDDLEEEQP